MEAITDRSVAILLAYTQARQREDAFEIFVEMRRDVGELKRAEILEAANTARALSRELRRVAWALGVRQDLD